MKISHYSFGNITINGETYTDVNLSLLCGLLRQFEIRTSKLDICRII